MHRQSTLSSLRFLEICPETDAMPQRPTRHMSLASVGSTPQLVCSSWRAPGFENVHLTTYLFRRLSGQGGDCQDCRRAWRSDGPPRYVPWAWRKASTDRFSGYGFLSENADFARMVEKAGLIVSYPAASPLLRADNAVHRTLPRRHRCPRRQGFGQDTRHRSRRPRCPGHGGGC
jgi:hypothetical protein